MAKKLYKFRFYIKCANGYHTSYTFRADALNEALVKLDGAITTYPGPFIRDLVYTGKYIQRDNK